MLPDQPPLTPAAAPRPGARDAVVELGAGESVAVRQYGAKMSGQAVPLVVHFHGGAFTSGTLDSGCTVASLLAAAGAVVVSVAYPLAPFPQPVNTGLAVLQWAHRQRQKLAGQGARLYLAGEEAGGNLAAAVALMARDQAHPPVAGQILLSPMLDPCAGTASLREATGDAAGCKWAEGWRQFLRSPRDAEHPYAVPGAAHRLAALGPSLILVGDSDPMRDEALAYAARLREAGLRVQSHVFAKVGAWPDALLHAGAHTCAGAAEVQAQLQQFFASTQSTESTRGA